jgi:hypothetical protein
MQPLLGPVHITQRGFRITLYCTTGSGDADQGDGGCNAKAQIFSNPLLCLSRSGITRNSKTRLGRHQDRRPLISCGAALG